MKPAAYIDVAPRAVGEVTMHDVMSFIVQKVHYASRHGKVAIGFPTMKSKPGLGDMVRVFAENIEVLNQVSDFLASDPRMDEYAVVRRPRLIPDGVSEYEAFIYFRMSHGLSSGRLARLGERGKLLHQFNMESRLSRADRLNKHDGRGRNTSGVAFATLYSASTKSQFRLHVERITCTYSEGEPNGYGLSRLRSIVAIPVF